MVSLGRESARPRLGVLDRKSTRLNSSHLVISYAVFCLKKKKKEAALLAAIDQDQHAVGVHSANWRTERLAYYLSVQTGYLFFFFNDTATTEIYTLSLHDALPI